MPTVVSLFSGIGGFDRGLELAGFTVVAQVETDPFCQRVLARRWPNVERIGGVETYARELRGHARPAVDLLCGGFPCQDLSVAGKRAGLGGARSSLFHEFIRIAHALTPTWGLVENVPGLISSHRGRDFWTVLQGLRECWPAVGWRILDSQHFGVAQRRRRVFLVGGPTEASVAAVLALTEGGGGDSPAGGEAGARAARGTIASTLNSGGNDGGFRTEPGEHLVMAGPLGGGNDGIGRRSEDDPNLVVAFDVLELADTLSVGANQTTGFLGDLGPAVGSSIRRLTPLECERLQSFPDGFTCLCQPLEMYAADPDGAALACRCPDSPRYRALGNAVTVNVIQWLGARLLAVHSSR